MRKERANGKIRAGVAALALCLLLVLPARMRADANSADRYWEGKTDAGVCVTDGDCPLEVLHEDLRFDIPSLDPFSYESDARVTATYTFYNPADYEVTARLAFPFGVFPYYAGEGGAWLDSAAYAVTVNGAPAECALRHTYLSEREKFSVEKDLPRLQDDYVTRGVFAPDAPVWQYTYRFTDLPPTTDEMYRAQATFAADDCVWFSDWNWCGSAPDSYHAGLYVENGTKVIVTSLGKPLAIEWDLRDNRDRNPVQGKAELLQTDRTAFKAYALASFDKESGVTQVDWYNAVTECLYERRESGALIDGLSVRRITDRLLRWYDYTVTVPAGGQIENAVTAPLCPSIDGYYEPPVYVYEYLLSPAATWAAFGSLDITVRTPYCMIESDGFAFTKGDGEYTLSAPSLPSGELRFSLCAEPDPKRVYGSGCDCGTIPFVVIFCYTAGAGILLIIAIAIGETIAAKKEKKKERNKK